MPSYVTHLESAIDGTRFEPGQLLGMHKDRPLWVRYDLAAVKSRLTMPILCMVGEEDTLIRPDIVKALALGADALPLWRREEALTPM